ncbi:hypothetical protein ACOSZF_00300 [Cytobacillus firmus]|uniref:Uncharacterized protein n=1 Tax=Cytobacillus firmus TaxID=1399 RepID=A0A800NFG8_CYTFI|nr:hypothetical protein [Cytobacillus firmus]KAF0825673.1 hypothetical protein KIS1582_0346 [Cytobacillus firmus]MBG9550281.1 hypothetical protein [Cytobacillus firmus]MBG9603881.1 hypothetical protein [Cytobacillus firmus]MED1940860.1 hypothetical protein [Cytobacillus firmus]NUH83371.1 hypothetical protein [Cytobacillus firmus]
MQYEMEIANLLAENINDFIAFINKNLERNIFYMDTDKLQQIKLIAEDYKFHILAEELIRINRFVWDPKYTNYLVNQFLKGLIIIDEYVQRNYNSLYMLTGRLYTLKNLSSLFSKD